MRRLTLALIGLLIAVPASAQYNCADANTICVPSEMTITACAAAATAGQTCYVAAGESYPTTIVTPTSSGTAGNPISFVAAPGTKPLVEGFSGSSKSYITVDGFNITMTGDNAFAINGSHIIVRNTTFNVSGTATDNSGNNISMTADHELIENNTFNNLADDAIDLFGQFAVIRGNTVNGGTGICTGPPRHHTDFFQSFNASFDHILIENNREEDVTGGCTQFVINNTNTSPPTVYIVRGNFVRNVTGSYLLFDNNGATAGTGQNAFYNNTFVNQFGSLLTDGSHAWVKYVAELNAPSSDTLVANNIIQDSVNTPSVTGVDWGTATNNTQFNNLYFGTSQTYTFASPASTESGAVKNQDPLLTNVAANDYSLKAGSPALLAGAALTTVTSGCSASTTSLVVGRPYAFQDGTWADGVQADVVAVGSVSNTVAISAINYSTSTITLGSAIACTNGDGVYLVKDSTGTTVLTGAAPNIGADLFGNGVASSSGPLRLRLRIRGGDLALLGAILPIGWRLRCRRR